MLPEANWCSQCYLPRQRSVAGEDPAIALASRQEAASLAPRPMLRTRWRKTPTTFGPVGRVVCTVLLLIPVPLLVVGTIVTGFGIVGLGIWVFVLMPWALRDVWKAGQLPAG
jgi:hypothetical protein